MANPNHDIPLGKVVVIGGRGFVGSHIVESIISGGYSAEITVLSRTSSANTSKVQHRQADISSLSSLLEVFSEIHPDVVIHTASAHPQKGTAAQFEQTNVLGTSNVIEAALSTGVKVLVFTSTIGVVQPYFKTHHVGGNEASLPPIMGEEQPDLYSRSKAEAEKLVLAANRRNGLLTCSLRPQAVFGPRDTQVLIQAGQVAAYESHGSRVQIGDGTNRFDVLYVGNLVTAHILAVQALLHASTVGVESIEEVDRVDGEAFFITNCEPLSFGNFAKMLWKALDDITGQNSKQTQTVIGERVALFIAMALSVLYGIVGKTPPLTEKEVYYSCMTAFYDNEKARKRLGYKVVYDIEMGLKISAQWIMDQSHQK